MITYFNPETFCRIVCEKLTERGERVRVIKDDRMGYDAYTLVLSCGVTVKGSEPKKLLLSLCQKIASLPHWGITGIRYAEPDAADKAAMDESRAQRETERKAKFKKAPEGYSFKGDPFADIKFSWQDTMHDDVLRNFFKNNPFNF